MVHQNQRQRTVYALQKLIERLADRAGKTQTVPIIAPRDNQFLFNHFIGIPQYLYPAGVQQRNGGFCLPPDVFMIAQYGINPIAGI